MTLLLGDPWVAGRPRHGLRLRLHAEFSDGQRELWPWGGLKQLRAGLDARERNDLWETFVEDFNTCTLPHKKYYDLRAWEVADHNKKAQKHSSKLKKEVCVTNLLLLC